jgi:hypothetical protein
VEGGRWNARWRIEMKGGRWKQRVEWKLEGRRSSSVKLHFDFPSSTLENGD